MAPYPWVVPWKRQQQNLDDFVNLRRWFVPSSVTAGWAEKGSPLRVGAPRAWAVVDAVKKLLFGQTAASVVKA
jgi:GST-like protein